MLFFWCNSAWLWSCWDGSPKIILLALHIFTPGMKWSGEGRILFGLVKYMRLENYFNDWIKKMWYIYVCVYVCVCVCIIYIKLCLEKGHCHLSTTWMELQDVMLNQIIQTKTNTVCIIYYKIFKKLSSYKHRVGKSFQGFGGRGLGWNRGWLKDENFQL